MEVCLEVVMLQATDGGFFGTNCAATDGGFFGTAGAQAQIEHFQAPFYPDFGGGQMESDDTHEQSEHQSRYQEPNYYSDPITEESSESRITDNATGIAFTRIGKEQTCASSVLHPGRFLAQVLEVLEEANSHKQITGRAISCLLVAIEAFLLELLSSCNLVAMHRQSELIEEKDLALTLDVRYRIDQIDLDSDAAPSAPEQQQVDRTETSLSFNELKNHIVQELYSATGRHEPEDLYVARINTALSERGKPADLSLQRIVEHYLRELIQAAWMCARYAGHPSIELKDLKLAGVLRRVSCPCFTRLSLPTTACSCRKRSGRAYLEMTSTREILTETRRIRSRWGLSKWSLQLGWHEIKQNCVHRNIE